MTPFDSRHLLWQDSFKVYSFSQGAVMKLRQVLVLALATLLVFVVPLAAQEGTKEKPIRIGFNAGDSPGIIRNKASVFTALLEERSGLVCRPVLADSYSQLIRAIAENRLDFAWLSPLGLITAEQVADIQVLLKAVRSGQPYYWSVILVRKDSGVRDLSDLKDKRFAFTHPGSTSGYVIPMSSLLAEGIDPDDYFSEVVYAGGHSKVINMILEGEVDAGATFADDPHGRVGSWTQEEFVRAADARKLKAVFTSDRIPSDTFSVTRGMLNSHPKLVERIKKELLLMGDSPAGAAILDVLYKISSLTEASSEDYAPVREAFENVRQR